MSEVVTKKLPKHWVWTTLGDVFNWGSGGTPKRTNPDYYDGEIPWLIIRDLNDGPIGDSKTKINEKGLNNSSAKWVEPGSVLVAMYGSIGKLGLATERLTTNQAIAFTLPEPNDAKFLFYYLMLSRTALAQQGKGIAQKNISQTVLKAFPFPLAPLEQQKRIVAKIEELFSHIDAGIEALKKAQQLLKQYRQSVLKAAVTGELTKDWREANKNKLEPASQLLERILKERRQKWEEQQLKQFQAKGKVPKDDKWKGKYKEPEIAVIDILPSIPEEWVWATLPQLGELNRGKSKHRPRNDPSLYGGDYPFIQTGDVRAANTWLKKYTQTYSNKGVAQSRLWPRGSMCITIAANIADTAILDFDACFPDSIVGFVPVNASVNVEVIEFFIRTVKSNLEKYAPATAQKNINLAILEKVAIPLLPRGEQLELLNNLKYKISMADRLESEIVTQLISADKNKQSVLASAFLGRLI
ncbi:MAG: restriction endonuclease subunit S [Methylococcales symbiont of Iophon sp. n. MRB-2018]|nr:MAG: restriction endonuclease subunit S [Methylococcales symbiont of Iophon sp. n. MRB-2018]